MKESILDKIKEGEHVMQDFKFCIEDSKKIARTLCAFANTQGGVLLIGVKDNGKIVGINPSEEIHMIEAAAELYCKPPLSFETRVWQENMRMVLEVQINKSTDKPVLALDENGEWKAYVRFDDHTIIASKIIRSLWKLEKYHQQKPEKMGDAEIQLLKHIAQSENCSLSKLYRTSSLSKKQIDHLLPLFLYWKLIAFKRSENGLCFVIEPEI